MIVDCISDLHGEYPSLPGGDLLLLGGDYTANDGVREWNDFYAWLIKQPYKHKVYIGGNHDNFLTQCVTSSDPIYKMYRADNENNIHYLCNDIITIDGYRIWGCPYTIQFDNQNPKTLAFTKNVDCQLEEFMLDVQVDNGDIDIFLCHCPMYGILDEIVNKQNHELTIENVGSNALRRACATHKPMLYVCGHIHEQGMKMLNLRGTCVVNASYLDENYRPRARTYMRVHLEK